MSAGVEANQTPDRISSQADTSECIVSTSFGSCRGVVQQDCFTFRGVPFAQAPVRFKRPERLQPWEGLRDCTRYGKQAVQRVIERPSAGDVARLALRGIKSTTGIGPVLAAKPLSKSVSEDCLYLNIMSPSLSGNAPVLVWIHGGAFVFGSGSEGLYRGTGLTRTQGIVVVTINYRLGCFGFLNVPGCDPNCGSWDQLEALRWVNSEIRSFGGDPSNVTICGESAGGMSCGVLLTSPLAQPFFQRCILMSGALSNVLPREDSVKVGQVFCQSLGVNPHVDALSDLKAEDLLDAQWKVTGGMPWMPCVDGELIPLLPIDGLRQKSISLTGKHVMVGCTVNEYNLFNPLPSIVHTRKALDGVVKKAAAYFGPDRMSVDAAHLQGESVELHLRELLKRMRTERGHANWGEVEKDLFTSMIFHAPAHLAAEALSETAEGVYMYSFAFDAGRFGSAHASELPLLFGMHNMHWVLGELSGARREPDAADAVSRMLMSRFGSFARSGTPNSSSHDSSDVLQWPKYTSKVDPSIFVFDRECKIIHEPEGTILRQVAALVDKTQRPFGVVLKSKL